MPDPTEPSPTAPGPSEPDPLALDPEPAPLLPGPTTSGGFEPTTPETILPQGEDPGFIPGATDGAPVGDVPAPDSFFPGSAGTGGGFSPTGDSFTSGGFSTPGLGDSVGEGLTPGDGPFGVMPGDTAVMGSDGMIGLPGGDPAIGGFGGGEFVGGGADGAFPNGEIAGADVSVADGVGGMGYGPMGGGVGSRNDEQDRYRQSWTNEDAELWNGGAPLAPSLIGR